MKKKIIYTLILMLAFCLSTSFNNNINEIDAKIQEQNACTAVTSNVVYYNANLYKYNYDGFNAAARNMSFATYNTLSADQKLALDQNLALTGPNSADVRAFTYTGIGLVRNTLDANGNVVNTKTNNNGVTFFPTQSEVNRINNLGFGTAYSTTYFNAKFPFIKLSNGYTRFYSNENHVKYVPSENKFELHSGAAGGWSNSSDTQVTGMWPFNSDCWPAGTTGYSKNALHYGMKLTIPFYMTADGKTVNFDTKQREDMLFNFAGDDDVWVFVDNKLILDIGGEHGEQTGYINFATNTTYTQITDSTTTNAFGSSLLPEGYHTLTIFYMERPGGQSNFKAEFNLPDVISYTGQKVWSDNNNAIGVRPSSYTLKLYRDNQLLETKTFTSNSWSFTELIKYKEDGTAYTYTVQEDRINLSNGDYYTPTISGTTVTNTLVRVPRNIYVKYVDQVTNEELGSDAYQGYVNTQQATSAKTISGYECVSAEKSKTLTYTIANQTITYYYRKNSNITVRYIDSNSGLPIITDIVTKYKEGDTYTTEEKTFDGYKIVGKTNNTSGTVVRDDIGVTYQYKKISTGVDIKYIDQVTGAEIATKEHIDGLENDTYTTTAKTVDGYELVKTPTNKDGKLAVGLITVTYEYRKNSNVIVKYLDENYATEIIQNVVTKYKEGDTYTTEEKLFDGYQITSKTDNTSGTVVREDIVVEYRYKKVSAGVDTKFIDQVTGEEIETVVHQTGLEKDAYTTTPKTIDGYELVKTPENAKGNMTVDLITVTYEYRKNSNVTVKYIDENYNTNIIEDIVTKYKEGDTYTTEEKTFDGYQLTRKTDNTSGTVVRENIEVVYYYKKISAGVDVKYIDQATGLNIADTEHLEGLEKDPYETEPKDIDDYILVFTPDNKDGEMVVDLTTVVYEYRMLSDVTTKFIDENYGTEITEEVKQTYKQGDPYSTKAKNLDGYQLVGQTNNTNGMVEREDIVVEYKYKKISAGVETKYIDQVTKEEIATPTHQSGLEKDAYTTSAKNVAGYELVLTPDNKDGEMTVEKITVTYEYRLVSKVTTKYIDVNSRTEIVTAVENNYKEGDAYTTEEKILEGYKLVGKSDNTSGTMGRSNIEVTYEYKKISNGIEVVYVDQVTGNPIAASVVKTGLENQEYTTEAKTIDGYELVTIPSNATGKMTVGKITVKYEYRKLSDVVAKYIDVNYNTEITEEVKQTLKEGDLYTTEEKSFDGYQLVNNPENKRGVIARENIEVVYEYKKISAGVDVKFIDQVTGAEIATKEHKDGLEKDNYTTEAKKINDYELVKTPTNKNGEMTVDLITVTYEYRLLSDVTTKHIDANTGKEIVDAVVDTYKEGDAYTTIAKDLVGYILTKSPEVPNGTMGREDIEVVYEYKMISDGLIVKYIDEITGDLLDMENYTGNENDMIQLEEKTFDKYILTKRPSVSEIKLTVEPQEVRFYYKKLIDINVIGIDAITGEEIYRKVQNGVEGEEYETTPVILPGYEITKTPDNASGTYTREDVDVIYEYKRVSGGVIVTYVDKDTREVLDSQTITGYVGEEYETDKKAYEKYDFVEVVGNPNGKLEVEQIEITYLYSKKIGEVEIVYVDTEGNELLKEEISGKVDEAYSIKAKEIEKYRLVETEGEVDGQFGLEKQIVKFVFEKIKGKITINFVDKDGNILFESVVTEGEIDEEYYYEALEKEGYEIAENAKIEVNYIDGEIIIDVVYEKIEVPEPPATGDVNVVLYIIIALGSGIVLSRKVQNFSKK